MSFIAYQTYEKGTFLSGWDTLHPEFDFDLNFRRIFFGVWRQEQGLGAVAAHTHMADLPRVVILWLFHFIAPLNLLRYIYIFICLILGPLGMYFFIQYLLFLSKFKNKYINAVAFISCLYYLLNFSTIQQFYVPFEMFPTQYAFLPWALLFSVKFYINKNDKSSLILFGIVTLLGTPQAYAAHLWYPFFGVYCLTLGILVLKDRLSLESIKKSLILIFLTITINSFWLLPNIYYIVTQSNTPITSKQNRLSSQEFQLKNRENGYLSDVSLIKGFYFNWNAYDYTLQKTTTLMPEWATYINQPYVKFIGYFLFSCSVFGFFLSLLRRNAFFVSLSPFILFPFVLLMNHTPPFEYVFNALNSFPLFEEALRFVFTKMSGLLIFGYCVYFAFFVASLCEFFHYKKSRLLPYLFLGVIFVSLIVYVQPVFKGRIISSKMKIAIPQEYFDLWSYMKNQKDGVILPLPLFTFSGWQYYNFGYQGAGFIWFGLKQAIMDRDFDRWNIHNEQAYNEFHNAVYSQSADQFDAVLKKYNIQYILWDHNVISPEQKNQNQLLFLNESDSLINRLILNNKLRLQKSFSSSLFLYQVNRLTEETEIKQIPMNVLPTYQKNYRDFAYLKNGDYISSELTNNGDFPTYYYPFRDILNENESMNLNNVKIDQNSNLYFDISNLSTDSQNIFIPKLSDIESILFASARVGPIDASSQQYQVSILPSLPRVVVNPIFLTVKPEHNQLLINDSFLFLRDPITLDPNGGTSSLFLKTREPNSINGFKFMPESEIRELSIREIDAFKVPLFLLPMQNNSDKETLMESLNTSKIVVFPLPDIPHNLGYIVGIESKYGEGLPLRVCMKNIYSGLCDLYTDVTKNAEYTTEYFLIPPTDENGGYKLEITSQSLGKYPSISNLRQVNIVPIQYNYLSNIYFFNRENNDVGIFQEKYPTTQYFRLPHYKSTVIKSSNPIQPNSVAVLNQAFHNGWKIYQIKCQTLTIQCRMMELFPFLFGTEIKEHVLVNNWANGWVLTAPEEGKIVIVFWPQYLEFAGFGLLILTFVIILVKKSYKQTIHHTVH